MSRPNRRDRRSRRGRNVQLDVTIFVGQGTLCEFKGQPMSYTFQESDGLWYFRGCDGRNSHLAGKPGESFGDAQQLAVDHAVRLVQSGHYGW